MNFIIKRLLNCMRRSLCVGLLLLSSLTVFSQRVALKTNALYWAAASPNLGLELRVNRHITFDLDATFHRLKWKDKLDTRAEILTPEVRYWFATGALRQASVPDTDIAGRRNMTRRLRPSRSVPTITSGSSCR